MENLTSESAKELILDLIEESNDLQADALRIRLTVSSIQDTLDKTNILSEEEKKYLRCARAGLNRIARHLEKRDLDNDRKVKAILKGE